MNLLYMVHGSERPPTNGDPLDFPLYKLIDEHSDKIKTLIYLVPDDSTCERTGIQIYRYIKNLDSNVKSEFKKCQAPDDWSHDSMTRFIVNGLVDIKIKGFLNSEKFIYCGVKGEIKAAWLAAIPGIPLKKIKYMYSFKNDEGDFEEIKSYSKPSSGKTAESDQKIAKLEAKIQNLENQHPEDADPDFRNFIGDSEEMRRVKIKIRSYAKEDVPVFIQGATGTGKTHVAKYIHKLSARNKKPWARRQMGAIGSPELVNSELFGHKKGAYTGASSDRDGLFKTADGGTVFLDEITEAPVEVQGKLLDVVENRPFAVQGSDELVQTDIRLITATNKNIDDEVSGGKFRQDLRGRIRVLIIKMPSLEKRSNDIPLFYRYFINQKGYDWDLSDSCLNNLKRVPYQDGIRTLESIVVRINADCNPNLGETLNWTDIVAVLDKDTSDKSKYFKEMGPPPGVLFSKWIEDLEGYWVVETCRQVKKELGTIKGIYTKVTEILGYSKQQIISRLKTQGYTRAFDV